MTKNKYLTLYKKNKKIEYSEFIDIVDKSTIFSLKDFLKKSNSEFGYFFNSGDFSECKKIFNAVDKLIKKNQCKIQVFNPNDTSMFEIDIKKVKKSKMGTDLSIAIKSDISLPLTINIWYDKYVEIPSIDNGITLVPINDYYINFSANSDTESFEKSFIIGAGFLLTILHEDVVIKE